MLFPSERNACCVQESFLADRYGIESIHSLSFIHTRSFWLWNTKWKVTYCGFDI